MPESKELSTVETVNAVINKELTAETANALIATTFKGLTAPVVKQAIMEGMMRGFTFEDFLKRNVYAIPFSGGYSLITSIDYARKIGMKSGIVGVDAPVYVEKDGKIETCSVTVKRKIGDYVGDYTATVYFDEYYKAGRNGQKSLWDTKPRTMISKVAEMHAIRKACPEQLAQNYIEEEMREEEPTSRMKEVSAMVEENDMKMGNFKHEESKTGKDTSPVEGTGGDSAQAG